MAALRWSTYLENIAVSASANLTLLQITAPTNQRVQIERILITGQGTLTSDTPVTFEIVNQTGGTGTSGGAATLSKSDNEMAETIQSTGKITWSAEPTTGLVKFTRNVHPQAQAEWVWPMTREFILKGGEVIGIRALSAAQASHFTILVEGVE